MKNRIYCFKTKAVNGKGLIIFTKARSFKSAWKEALRWEREDGTPPIKWWCYVNKYPLMAIGKLRKPPRKYTKIPLMEA